jgi:hypothetical protein
MFIFTAKFNRRIAVAVVIGLAVVLGIIIILAGHKDSKSAATVSRLVKTNEERVNYLTSFGWEVSKKPLEEQDVVIPRNFSGVYADYVKLQDSQGFSLSDYAGMEAKRYTYDILNYPSGERGVVADIIIYRNTVIAADVQSTSLNGFMHRLELSQ